MTENKHTVKNFYIYSTYRKKNVFHRLTIIAYFRKRTHPYRISEQQTDKALIIAAHTEKRNYTITQT